MRGRSSKQGNKGGIEAERLSKLKEEPHLSGAYIRNLVKQLTSSRPKDQMNPRASDNNVDGDGLSQNLPNFSEGLSEETQHQAPQQQPKKQVRRRLHTSRPYQERLLNMAEARREIVTALKFHRASMKQANEQQQQHQHQPSPSSPQPLPPLPQDEVLKARRNPPSNFSNYLDNLSYSSFSPPPSIPIPYCSWGPSIAPLPNVENLNFLPNHQPLGLNLNFHDFNNLDTTLYYNNNTPSSLYSYSSSSSSPSLSCTEEAHSVAISPEEPPMMVDVMDSGVNNGGLHAVMDDEEMAEIRSLGEQHEMAWNDTLNFVKSAWWFKFLNGEDDDGFHVFDEIMEFPSWMNANESCFLQQHLDDDYCSKDYLHENALPCMDIGEIDGMDGDWLA
ncbi:hypothetical protein GIB67_009007 [Kingdonia uniflora]|uniref:Uncharacterized protein n=1 Tax=Kingdonia uniflora TaxID=39325 RepID=A0A7J7LVM6_9MAGN|nr:hypothetical protein GIB67_009007 [Kingdonia uniflora]